MTNLNNITSLSTSALIVNLSISVWTGRKLDKRVSQEIDQGKNTKARAGNYHKNLFAGSTSLEHVNKLAGEIRTWHYHMTQPWGDNGDRILNVASMLEYRMQLENYEQQFVDAVNVFLKEYNTLISTAAFTLGDLFVREDYPEAEEIESKFGFNYMFSPVPMAGDFRLDINMQGLQELQAQYEEALKNRVQMAMDDAWGRVTKVLNHMSDKLEDTAEGKHKIFRDTLVDNAIDLCEVLRNFNLTGDPKLETVRKRLEALLRGLDGDSLRQSVELRHAVKRDIDILREETGIVTTDNNLIGE